MLEARFKRASVFGIDAQVEGRCEAKSYVQAYATMWMTVKLVLDKSNEARNCSATGKLCQPEDEVSRVLTKEVKAMKTGASQGQVPKVAHWRGDPMVAKQCFPMIQSRGVTS